MDYIWRFFGFSKASFNAHPDSLVLQSSEKATRLIDLCKSIVPLCWLNPFLFNGHLQTCWTAIKERGPLIYYKRRIFFAETAAYAGSFTVDFVVQPNEGTDPELPPRTTYLSENELGELGGDDETPTLVVLHGLSGGSHEVYIRCLLDPLVGKEWKLCVINARGCAQSSITSDLLFNARATWDLRQLVKWLQQMFPNRPLFAMGFSLGGNILVNYLGEEGEKCLLKAAVVCSNPWNLDVGSIALQSTWLGLEVYSRTMGANLRSLFERSV
ncbi:hypothetical protein Q9189_002016 [Teloschistes chrysophthalmus]